MPRGAHERGVADQILLNLQHVLGDKPSRTSAEQEFVMRTLKTWDDVREEARTEGRAEQGARARC